MQTHPFRLDSFVSRERSEDQMEFYATAPFEDPLPAGIRIVCISDTHNLHEQIPYMPEGDVLIHAGDFSSTGVSEHVQAFVDWFGSQNYAHKIFIAGNHDVTLDKSYYVATGAKRFHRKVSNPEEYAETCMNIVRSNASATYLEDTATHIEIPMGEGISRTFKIYGAPWQPEFCNWAFNLERGQPLKNVWQKIPSDTEILITHGPPFSYGDSTADGFQCGCVDLLNTIASFQTKPRIHIFGHIHEDYGKIFLDYVVISDCNLRSLV